MYKGMRGVFNNSSLIQRADKGVPNWFRRMERMKYEKSIYMKMKYCITRLSPLEVPLE